jgi:hypothetical protein
MAENATAKAMRKLADGAVGLAAKRGVALDYTPGSIDCLEQYLSELHDYLRGPECRWTDRERWSAALAFGAYVGEVLRRAAGGEWKPDTLGDPELVVGPVTMRPPQKVLKRLTNGLEDHLGHYFRGMLTAIAAASAGAHGRPDQ